MKNKISITLNERTLHEVDRTVDNIFVRNRSQAIEHLIMKGLGQQKSAVILAGGPAQRQRVGQGYRTTAVINGISLIERNLRKLRENNFKHVILIAEEPVLTSVFSIVQEGTKYGLHLEYVEDIKSQGSMDSLRRAQGKISTQFMVVYGDIFFSRINLNSLWNDHLLHNGIATLLLTTSASKKGTVKMEGSRILDFEQAPKSAEYLGFSSLFIAEPEIFEVRGRSLEEDVFPHIARAGGLFGHISSEKEVHIHTAEDARKAMG